jgi:hypothetical protein
MSNFALIRPLVGVLTVLAIQSACATATRVDIQSQRPAHTDSNGVRIGSRSSLSREARRAGDVLTAAQIASVAGLRSSDTYDAVRHLRPQFLARPLVRAAHRPSAEQPMVFVNGILAGGIEVLRRIPVSVVSDVAYVRPADAANRYGPAHAAGVILVRTAAGTLF